MTWRPAFEVLDFAVPGGMPFKQSMTVVEKTRVLVGQSFPVWDFAKAINSMASGQSSKTLLHFNH